MGAVGAGTGGFCVADDVVDAEAESLFGVRGALLEGAFCAGFTVLTTGNSVVCFTEDVEDAKTTLVGGSPEPIGDCCAGSVICGTSESRRAWPNMATLMAMCFKNARTACI